MAMGSLSQTQVLASQPSPYPGMSMLEWNRLNAVSQQYYLNRLSSKPSAPLQTAVPPQVVSGGGAVGIGGGGGGNLNLGNLGNLASLAGGTTSVSMPSAGRGATSLDDPNLKPGERATSLASPTTTPEYSQYQDSINKQNELATTQQTELQQLRTQYDDLVNRYNQRDTELTQYLSGLGDAERESIEQRREQLKSQAKQDLLNRGITSTSALDAVMRGIETSSAQSLGQFEERLRQQKLDARATFSGETLAAQDQALQFGAGATGQNFAAGQQSVDSMQALAEMMSNQRLAGFQTQAELRKAALSSSNNALSSILGYKSDLAKIALGEKELASQEALGYAGLANQQRLAALDAATARDTARMNNLDAILKAAPRPRSYGGVLADAGGLRQ